MKAILIGWILFLSALTGYGVWATYTGKAVDEASDYDFSLREDAVTGVRPLFFKRYFKGRGPRGGGLGFGK